MFIYSVLYPSNRGGLKVLTYKKSDDLSVDIKCVLQIHSLFKS